MLYRERFQERGDDASPFINTIFLTFTIFPPSVDTPAEHIPSPGGLLVLLAYRAEPLKRVPKAPEDVILTLLTPTIRIVVALTAFSSIG